MKRKQQSMNRYRSDSEHERVVQQEIENFLQALASYPEQFERQPKLSFHEHLYSVAASHPPLIAERRRNPGN